MAGMGKQEQINSLQKSHEQLKGRVDALTDLVTSLISDIRKLQDAQDGKLSGFDSYPPEQISPSPEPSEAEALGKSQVTTESVS